MKTLESRIDALMGSSGQDGPLPRALHDFRCPSWPEPLDQVQAGLPGSEKPIERHAGEDDQQYISRCERLAMDAAVPGFGPRPLPRLCVRK